MSRTKSDIDGEIIVSSEADNLQVEYVAADRNKSVNDTHYSGRTISAMDENDIVRLGEKKKRVDVLAEIASFPPYATGHFNPDGTNTYKSKL